MEGIKLIDASEVSVKKKASKVEIEKISKSPLKIIADVPIKNIAEIPIKIITEAEKKNIIESTVKSSDQSSDKLSQDTVGREIRAIKIKQDIYYGPKNINKNKFMRMYKKLGLAWMENVSIDNTIVNGWFNKDRSQYIIKLLEEGDFKRFKFYGCDSIYVYFINLGAVTIDIKENSIVPQLNIDANVSIGVSSINVSSDIDKNIGFVGADLWSGYRTRQLLKNMPDNLGVIWK